MKQYNHHYQVTIEGVKYNRVYVMPSPDKAEAMIWLKYLYKYRGLVYLYCEEA
jgi:hypothetical protein